MADFTVCLYEQLHFDGFIAAVVGAGVTDSGTLDMSGYRRVLGLIAAREASDAAATLDIEILQCTLAANAANDAKPIAGKRGAKAITPVIAGPGFANLNLAWAIEVRAEEMDVNNGFAFLLLRTTVSAGDTWDLTGIGIRDVSAYKSVETEYITEIVD